MSWMMLIPIVVIIFLYFAWLTEHLKGKGLKADLKHVRSLAREWNREKHWLAGKCGELSDVNVIKWLDRAAKEALDG